MARLLVHVEGQTEETFVKEILAPHLCAVGYETVTARLLGNARQRGNRGGIRSWVSARNDILRHLREDQTCRFTTMVDFYGLPQSGDRAWPGREVASNLAFSEKAVTVENALMSDICDELGTSPEQSRFLPYVMMHEFEALLFSDCQGFSNAISRPELAPKFQDIRSQFSTPEEINDSPTTHPSKRIDDLVLGYQKPFHGVLAVISIGLDRIRAECPHFRDWVGRLEAWGHS